LASDAADGLNPLSSPYSNTQVDSQTIYVRIVKDDTGCVNSSYSFNVVINPLPDFQLTSPQIVCLNDPTLVLAPENPAGIYDYVWNDPEGNETVGSQLDPTVGGVYSLTGTRTREVTVTESIIATLTDADISIVDDSENNSISIDPTNLGIGDYEYALADDNGNIIANYQDDPLFENLEGGFYTVLVRDKNGCGTASLDVPVVEFPRFFTPNNDGVNDTWAIKGANSIFFPESEVNIFNRFGKVVAQIRIDNPGWDGTFNGKTLPSDDYWFSIRLVDRNGNVRTRTGNMSLLRRE
jgi:gliding motility-associated-like protein